MSDFKKLLVWQKAHALTLTVYRETAHWPRHEQYGLVSQTRRAAASIASNIAEGCGRDSDAELAGFISIAKGSAAELSYLMVLASELGYMSLSSYDRIATALVEVQRMLWSFERRLRESVVLKRARSVRSAVSLPTRD
jgi:four helix bundle protein